MRNITPEMADALSAPVVEPALLAELYFDSGTLRLWSGLGTLDWGDKQFLGGGNLVGISPIEENQSLEAKGIIATLNGVPSNLVATVLLENQRGRQFRLYLGVVSTRSIVNTEDGGDVRTEDDGFVLTENQLIDTPYRIFNGLMDTMEIVDSGETSTISVNVESIMIIGQRAKDRRYTPEDQKKYYPEDKGLDYIPSLQDKEIVW